MKPLLSTITPQLNSRLKGLAHSRTYASDEELFAAGERADYLPIIVKGKAKMVQFPEPGKEVIIGMFGDGEMFAVPPVIDGKLYPASAYALTESEILLLHRSDFQRLLSESEEFMFAVLEWMADMLRQKTSVIQTLAGGTAEQRIAGVLIRLVGDDRREPPIKIRLRREDIAKMAGVTTETAIRTIRKLAEKGELRIEHGKIFIDDMRQLMRHLTT